MPLKINFKSVLMYAIYALCAVLLNSAVKGVPLSLGLLAAMLICGTNAPAVSILYVLASTTHLDIFLSLFSLFEAAFLCTVTLLYRRTKRKIRVEVAAYIAIALAPYIAFAPWKGIDLINSDYAMKGIAAGAVIVFSFFCFKAVYALIYRIMRCKLKEDELVCCAIVYAAAGTGIYNLTGAFVYTAVAAGILVFFIRLTRSPAAIIIAVTLAIPPALTTLSLQPFTVYILGCISALLFCNAGRISPSIVTAGLCAGYFYLTGGFKISIAVTVINSVMIAFATILPAIPSTEYLKRLKNRLILKEVLPDTAVARERRRTGEKLFRISEVFREMECAFKALDDDLNDGASKRRIIEDLKEKCCKNCEKSGRCSRTDVYAGFKKLIDTGCVKGKVNLIDLPSEVTVNCNNPTDVLVRLNGLLAEYRRFMTEAENAKSGRILLAEQARGVAEVMKACAVEMSSFSGEFSEAQIAVKDKLSARGITCPELYINADCGDVSAVVCGKINAKAAAETVSETLGRKYVLKDKLDYDGEKCCLVFGAPPRLDAAFGVAYEIKKGEKVSGDTHSVIRINEHSFLMALSDGMGSGEYAKKVSATAISLIEAFYRAEMPENTVLATINKLLSFNRDERFTCIDIAAVNLNSGIANFVKIGSPAGIIVREGEIKVLESQSLPLGILENLKPTVCTEQLKSGDIVVFMSDGITSAFPSTTELYEFLQELKPLNPQNLADKILAGAKARVSEVCDDMTVLCTRIYEK